MSQRVVNPRRLIVAGLAAGVWVLISGLIMAAAFGYHDMRVAFERIGLAIPVGLEPFLVHTSVRLVLGLAVVWFLAIASRTLPATQAMLLAAAFTWLLSSVLPFVVIVEWGLFPWSLAAKLWVWSAGELLVAAAIGRRLYRV